MYRMSLQIQHICQQVTAWVENSQERNIRVGTKVVKTIFPFTRRDFFIDFFPAFIGGGRPQVPLQALFQTRAGTWVEPPTFP
jgi:hypothetical protein